MMIDRTIRCWTVTKRLIADSVARLLRVKPPPPAAGNLNNIRRLAAGVRSVPKPPAHYSLGLRARVLHAITPSAGGGPAAHPALHHVHGTRRIRSVCIVVGVGTLAGAVVGGTILSIGGGTSGGVAGGGGVIIGTTEPAPAVEPSTFFILASCLAIFAICLTLRARMKSLRWTWHGGRMGKER